MNTKEQNELLWRYGYPWAPTVKSIRDDTEGLDGPLDKDGKERVCPDRFKNLAEMDEARQKMVELFQSKMWLDYRDEGIAQLGRDPLIDGVVGPVTKEVFKLPRCGCPDFAFPKKEGVYKPEEAGIGPWKGCHNVGDAHAAHFQYQNDPPSHMNRDAGDGETIFTKALRKVREVNAKKGLLCYFSGPGIIEEFHPEDMGSVQSRVSWTRGNGWIGLAIVGRDGMPCSETIWIQYDNSFTSSYDIARAIHGMVLLKLHEQGHNEGLGHTSGGIMNPSLRLSTTADWEGDVAEEWQRRRFGFKPVPIPGPGPGPEPPDPEPPDDDDCNCTVLQCVLKIVGWVIQNWSDPKEKSKLAKTLKRELGE